MKKGILKVKIEIESRNSEENPHGFWRYFSGPSEKTANHLEKEFIRKFPEKLKNALQNDYREKLDEATKLYRWAGDGIEFLERMFRYAKERDFHADTYFHGLSKLQEMQNDFFKDNNEYQNLFNKFLIATQISFSVKNINYSSLGFELCIEPIEKLITLFDKNFEFFYIFLNQYIPSSFIESIDATISEEEIITYIYPDDLFIQNFAEQQKTEIPQVNKRSHADRVSRWLKANWAWGASNLSLLIPVVLSLFVLNNANEKVEKYNGIYERQQNEILVDYRNMSQNYRELLNTQIDIYKLTIQKQSISSTRFLRSVKRRCCCECVCDTLPQLHN